MTRYRCGLVWSPFTFPPADFIAEKGNCHTFSPPEGSPPMAPFLVCTIVEPWCEFVRLHRRAGHAVHLHGRRPQPSAKMRFQRLPRQMRARCLRAAEARRHTGEQHTGRAVASEGRSERYRGPPFHQPRQSECYRPTFFDELQSAVISQQTLVALPRLSFTPLSTVCCIRASRCPSLHMRFRQYLHFQFRFATRGQRYERGYGRPGSHSELCGRVAQADV